MDGYAAALIFMGPPLVGSLLAGISIIKTSHETTKTSQNSSRLVQGTKLSSVTWAQRKFTMLLCSLETSFYKKLLSISLTFTLMLQNKCSTSLKRSIKSRSYTQTNDNMQKLLRLESCTRRDQLTSRKL